MRQVIDMLSDRNLERLERKVFDVLLFHLKQDRKKLIDGLNSRIKILNDWYPQFIKTARKGYNASDLDTGAERIFSSFFAPILRFPNSSPIGSDLMYEHSDAFIHIEIKTSLIGNEADYKGKVNIGVNQTSYGIPRGFTPNLPTYYMNKQKPCLTYAIHIIHEHAKPNIIALSLICIPNGQLYKHYQKSIIRAGKSGFTGARDIRYKYAAEPHFKLLKQQNNQTYFRIEIVCLDKKFKPQDITTIKNLPVHFWI